MRKGVRSSGRRARGVLVAACLGVGCLATAATAPSASATVAGFVDVRGNEYYAAPVTWMRAKRVTTGLDGGTRFAPHGLITRAEVATFLWRVEGQPRVAAPHGFVDVPSGSYYDAAVRWMKARRITTGVGASNRFEPARHVTRAELATLMWRVAGAPRTSGGHGFVDVPAGSYFDRPVAWMKRHRITTGVGGSNRFDPQGTSTRGQVAAFLWRAEGSPKPPSPGDSRDCSSFRIQPEAQGWYVLYKRWYGDVARLDPDGDGVACPGLPGPRPFPTFTPEELKQLHLALEPLAQTSPLHGPPAITGHPAADARIRALAEARGYRLRAVPAVPLTSASGVPLVPVASQAYMALRADAAAHGLRIFATSGYRSVDLQRSIFRRKMGGYSAAQIASGQADGAIHAALRFNSIPGYSKHHTGRTVDVTNGGSKTGFEGTGSERWLRDGNFHNAKRHGFIPSYPRGASHQGPDPEPWEYVHVGVREIRCAAFLIPMADPAAASACP